MKRLVIFILSLLFCSNIIANGGIPWQSIDSKGSKIILKSDSDLVLIKEDLGIQLIEDFAIVTCEYKLVNNSSTEKTIDFAFNIPVVLGNLSISYFLSYYKIIDDNGLINFQTKIEIDDEGPFETSLIVWKISTLTFQANKSKTVKIIYKIKTNTDGKSCAAEFNNNIFKYNLFPATSFGNGIIEEFNLSIDKTDIMCHEGRIVRYSGIDIKNEDNEAIQKYSFRNFDLNKNREIKIEYDIAGYYICKFISDEANKRYFSKITATSVLNERGTVYSADNLKDHDYSTPWVEGKKDFGKNEKIHFELFDYNLEKSFTRTSITHLYLVNGFRKNAKTYLENNRLKKIRLYINGKVCCEINLEDRPYKEINDSNIAYEADLLNGLIDDEVSSDFFLLRRRAFYNVHDFDIEILEVYPGTKYDDTCISEVLVMNVGQPTI